jgi:hypothetical protein
MADARERGEEWLENKFFPKTVVEVKILRIIHIFSEVLDPSVVLCLCELSSQCFSVVLLHYNCVVFATQCLIFQLFMLQQSKTNYWKYIYIYVLK